eukprot:SAG22_NODE_106_length_19904_cov_14.387175_4_plen_161_part_00
MPFRAVCPARLDPTQNKARHFLARTRRQRLELAKKMQQDNDRAAVDIMRIQTDFATKAFRDGGDDGPTGGGDGAAAEQPGGAGTAPDLLLSAETDISEPAAAVVAAVAHPEERAAKHLGRLKDLTGFYGRMRRAQERWVPLRTTSSHTAQLTAQRGAACD